MTGKTNFHPDAETRTVKIQMTQEHAEQALEDLRGHDGDSYVLSLRVPTELAIKELERRFPELQND